jgi:asparagine N-glycosylation enzyme membrane subunit Stt3
MTDKSRSDFFFYLAFSTCIAIALTTWYLLGKTLIPAGDLSDSDCYMHLIRASDLYETGRWYDPVIERSNAPYGDRLHWTRPFDLLLLAGAIPGSRLTSFSSSLFWWGVIISPAILILVLLALRWAARPLLGEDGASISGFLLAVQVGVVTYLQAGRPDHHGLLLLLFVLSLGLVLRLIERPFRPGLCVAAGAVGALSMWTSVESLVTVAVFLSVLGGLWIRYGGDSMTKASCYSASLFVLTCLALVIERPWLDLATVEFDRLSIAHGVVFGLTTVSLLVLSLLAARANSLQRWKVRLGVALVTGAILALAIGAILPGFYGGARMDTGRGMARVLAHVGELQPLVSGEFFWTFGVALVGYGILFLGLLLCRRISLTDPRWMLVLAAAVVFMGLAFYQVRWAMYGQVVLLLPAVALIIYLRTRVSRSQRGLRRLLINVGITAVFLLLPISGPLVVHFAKKAEPSTAHPQSSVRAMCRYLTTDTQWRGRKLRILAEINYGAEILYRTPHEVIATLYHRNWQAIADACAIMAARTDEEAQSRIRRRGIDLILLAPEASDESLFADQGQTSTFYRWLCDGELAPWCRPVQLPDDLSSFRLFAITPD